MVKKSRRSSSRKMKHTRKHKTHRRRTHRRRGGAEGAPVNYHLSGSWPSKMSLGQGADYFKYHEGQHGGGLSYGAFPSAVLSTGLPQELRGPAHIGGIDKAIADVRGLSDAPNSSATVGGRRNRSRRNRSSRNRSRRNRSRRNKSCGGSRNRSRRNRNRRNRTGGSRRKNNSTYTVTVSNAKVANAAANSAVANAVKANNAAAAATNAATNAVVAANAATPASKGGRNRRNRRRSGGALGFAPFPSSGMLLSSPTAYAQAGLNPEWKTDVAFTDAKIRDTQ